MLRGGPTAKPLTGRSRRRTGVAPRLACYASCEPVRRESLGRVASFGGGKLTLWGRRGSPLLAARPAAACMSRCPACQPVLPSVLSGAMPATTRADTSTRREVAQSGVSLVLAFGAPLLVVDDPSGESRAPARRTAGYRSRSPTSTLTTPGRRRPAPRSTSPPPINRTACGSTGSATGRTIAGGSRRRTVEQLCRREQ